MYIWLWNNQEAVNFGWGKSIIVFACAGVIAVDVNYCCGNCELFFNN